MKLVNKIRNIFLSAVLMGLVFVPVVAHAEISDSICDGANLSFSQSTKCDSSTVDDSKLNKVISLIVNILSVVVGVVAVIMIIVGGFKYITSGGDSNKVTSAKNTILYAIIGLVVVALAQFIVRFVVTKVKQ